MDKFIAETGTAYFWLTTVLVALAVNIASAYVKAPLDALLGRYAKRRRERSASKNAELEAEAVLLASNLMHAPFVVASELRRYLIGLYFTLIATALFYLGTLPKFATGAGWVGPLAQLVMMVVGLGMLILGAVLISTGLDEASLLRRARELHQRPADGAEPLTMRDR